MHELPSVLGYIVRNSGAVIVDRPTESKDETEEQKQARREKNQEAQAIGGRILANGGHWLIYPEGLTRQTIIENGEEKKVPRKPGVLLPVQKGFVYTLNSMTPEQLQRVRILGMAVHYGGRLASSLRPTVYVTKPEVPIQGTVEEKRQQGEDILRRAVQEAVLIDSLRRI